MNAYATIGYNCLKLSCSLNGSSWFNYDAPSGVGIPDAINYLNYKYQNKLFQSTASDFDITSLARTFYRLSKFPELQSLDLVTKGD